MSVEAATWLRLALYFTSHTLILSHTLTHFFTLLSFILPYRRWVWRWHQHYDPALDADHQAVQKAAAALQKAKQAEYQINKDLRPHTASDANDTGKDTDDKPRKDAGSAFNA